MRQQIISSTSATAEHLEINTAVSVITLTSIISEISKYGQ